MRSNLSTDAPRKAQHWRLGLCGVLVGVFMLALLPATAHAANQDVYVTDAVDGCHHHCFVPETVTINDGDTVTWRSVSGEEHDILRCTVGPCPHDGGTGTGPFPEILLEPSEVAGHTFTGPGTYHYYCNIHGYNDMHGTVNVAGDGPPSSPPPADFDGDRRSDIGIFRPSAGAWFVRGSAGTDLGGAFGTSGDVPVPGDYDGDGDADMALFRNGIWFINGGPTVAWGTSGDVPVPADYDGDGETDVAVFRNGLWFIHNGPTLVWGTTGDVPVPGDYDGDGDADVAVFRPNGLWFIHNGPTLAWGTTGDVPVPGDYDGDGDTDVAVFRPAQGYWFVQGGLTTQWGASGDVPVPGDYDGDGDTDVAVFRPSSGYWFVQGGAVTRYGTSSDIPLNLPAAVRLAYFA